MKESKGKRIEIELSNGYKLVAEKNTDPQYSREIFIGVEDADGVWHQDLAVVRSSYKYKGDTLVWNDEQFDVLVYGREDNEDFTDDFTVGLFKESK